jgi:catechol 2,3-dioxygenase-like lactoylglutathione lyase family enzyme
MRVRHVASIVRNIEKAAAFYEKVFGLRRLSPRTPKNFAGRAIDLSDGNVNLALLSPPDPQQVVTPAEMVRGPLHIGIAVRDPAPVLEMLAEFGIQTYAHKGALPDFFKFLDPEGIEFDVVADPALLPTGRVAGADKDWSGLRHVAYVVANLERAADFYQTVFGFTRLEPRAPLNFPGEVVDLTDGELHLGLVSPTDGQRTIVAPAMKLGLMHIGIVVDDIVATLEAVQAFGIVPYATEGDPPHFCKVRDPDGIEIDVAAHDDVFALG